MNLSFVSRCFLLDNKNNILLIKHRSPSPWVLPWWHLDKNESPATALRRELREELDVGIEILWIRNATNDPQVMMQPMPISIHEIEYFSAHEDKMVRKCEFRYFARMEEWKIKTNKEIVEHKRFSVDEILKLKPNEEVYSSMKDVLEQNEDLLELL